MGGELRELIEYGDADRFIRLLAIFTPIACLLVGGWVGKRRRTMKRGALLGLGIGLFGPLVWLLWCVFNAITAALGLDSVRNLLVNGVVFIVTGAVIGASAGWVRRRLSVKPDTRTTAPQDKAPETDPSAPKS